jgi:hypothetical protein
LYRFYDTYGKVNVRGGARIRADGTTSAFSQAAVTVDGEGSKINFNSSFLASGTQIAVANGGDIYSSGSVELGRSWNATVWVTGAGSTWTAGLFYVGTEGGNGWGLMTVTNQARTCSLQRTDIAQQGATYGRLVVTGTNTSHACQDLYVGGWHVGQGGNGTLHVADGAIAAISRRFLVYSSGKVEVNRGTVRVAANQAVRNQGILRGVGFYALNGASGTYIVTNSATVSPGFSNAVFGALVFSNCNFRQEASGTMAFELGGAASNQYDRLRALGGTLTLGGACAVSLVNGFLPSAGDTFDLLDWTTLGPTRFAAVSLPALPAPCYWVTNRLYTTGEILAWRPGGTVTLLR